MTSDVGGLTINPPASQPGATGFGSGDGMGGAWRGCGYQDGRGTGNHVAAAAPLQPATFTGELSYPSFRPLTAADRTPVGTGRAWSLPDAVRNAGPELNRIKNPSYPTRQAFLDPESKHKVLTNHFEYSVIAGVLYEYKLLNVGSKDKRRTKEVYQKAIETWDFLKFHKTKFVTNNFDTIIAWENLHQYIPFPPSRGDGETTGIWNMVLQDGSNTLTRGVELVRQLDVRALQQYSNADPKYEQESFDAISKCLNLVISKTFDDSKLYRQAANKFFVKDARVRLTMGIYPDMKISESLEIVRGYYYTVKPGTGNIILNFNLATSAFFKPITVDKFLADQHTFVGRQEDNLKGLRVYVLTERIKVEGDKNYEKLNSESSRTKKVNFIGPNIDTLSFQKRRKNADGSFVKNAEGTYQKDPGTITVLQYLKDSKFAIVSFEVF
jgi:eukaryotic translation initiation factor 2C